MGLFDRFGEAARNLVGQRASAALAGGANKALTIITHPIASVVNFSAAEKVTAKQGMGENLARGLLNTGLAIGGTAVVTTAALRSAAVGAIGRFAAENPIKTAVGIIATPVLVSAASKSEKVTTGIINAPSSLSNFGSNIGNLIQNPSLENVKKVVSENPLLTGVTAVAATIGVAGLLNTAATAINTHAINKQSETQEKTKDVSPTNIINNIPQASSLPLEGAPPMAKKKKKKAQKKKKKKARSKRKSIKRRKTIKKHGNRKK